MWWIFGLINVIIIILCSWFIDKKIKEGDVWSKNDKISLWTLLIISLFGGYVVTLIFFALFVFFVIDFIRFICK